MTKNIFIVEGLPGVGKSYFCEILQQEIRDKTGNKRILFFEERDIDHPFHCTNNDIANDIWSGSLRSQRGGTKRSRHELRSAEDEAQRF